MSRVCSICTHRDRAAIEQSLTLGWSQRQTGERFGVSASSLSRHQRGHHSELQELRREKARLQAERERLEANAAVVKIHERAGWDKAEAGYRIRQIVAALVGADDFDTLAGLLRGWGIEESLIWETISESARARGDDPGAVWEQIYAPAL